VDAKLEEDRVFVNAVEAGDGSEIQSTYADAVGSLAIRLAANESMETGEPVMVSSVLPGAMCWPGRNANPGGR
jgi:hypothetical protein